MHEVSEFAAPDSASVELLVRRHPFALVASCTGSGSQAPEASHLPVVPAPGQDLTSGMVGGTLWGHMARANAQWRAFAAETRVLVVFGGASGYVSPSVYGITPAAPTWNYAAVHVTGQVCLIEDESAALRLMTTTVAALEGQREQPWDMEASLGYFRRILPGIVAFSIEVESVQAMFKFSQDKPEPLRARVREAFATDPAGRPVADAMGQTGAPIS